jgi:hypothetical protein
MDTHEFAVWMQHEHHAVDKQVYGLKSVVGHVPPVGRDDWLDTVRTRFEHLRAHLIKHMTLEEHDGYMSNVLEQRPTLHEQVRRLERQHPQIVRLLNNIHRDLAECRIDDCLLLDECCLRIRALLDAVEQHEAAENLIVLSVFTNDIGTKD